MKYSQQSKITRILNQHLENVTSKVSLFKQNFKYVKLAAMKKMSTTSSTQKMTQTQMKKKEKGKKVMKSKTKKKRNVKKKKKYRNKRKKLGLPKKK
jgi:deoxyribodipyrimidine photolyase-like uncharacterized protein